VHHVQALQCHLWPSAGPRAWYVKLDSSMQKMGYMPTCSNSTVCKKGKMIALFYVDDALLAAQSKEMRAKANRDISSKFEVCDLGEAKRFLGKKFQETEQYVR
jgi:hypothetical protein